MEASDPLRVDAFVSSNRLSLDVHFKQEARIEREDSTYKGPLAPKKGCVEELIDAGVLACEMSDRATATE